MIDLNLNSTNVPLIAGKVVNFDQQNIIQNSHIINSSGFRATNDLLHFTAEGYRELVKKICE